MSERLRTSNEDSMANRAPKQELRSQDLRRRFWHKLGGALLFMAGSVILMGIITAEALYPAAYSTSQNEISDLGATRPPNSVILQPSATIFDATMIVTGLMIIGGAYCVHHVFRRSAATIPLGLLGFGVLGVGIFPGNYAVAHPIFAMLAFTSGGAAAVLSYRVLTSPLRYIAVVLGGISLINLILAIFLGEAGLIAVLGDGGAERWTAYPVILWLVGFGGYLMGLSPQQQASSR